MTNNWMLAVAAVPNSVMPAERDGKHAVALIGMRIGCLSHRLRMFLGSGEQSLLPLHECLAFLLAALTLSRWLK
jgi:hypothetical protein